MSEQLMSTIDAARLLGVSSECVRKFERNGRLRAMRTVSGQRIFQMGDVQKLALERAHQKAEKLQAAVTT